MPIYEYRCESCKARITVWARTASQPAPPCTPCGSTRVDRLLSRFASPRSEEARMEALADPSTLAGLDEGDPRSMVRWMKRLGRETGEDLGGGFDEDIDRAADDTADESSLAEHGDLEP